METQQTLYEYLAPYLDSGASKEVLAKAKEEFRKEYKRQWRRNKRQQNKEYTISYDRIQLQSIKKAAKDHHRSITCFIKDTALAVSRSEVLQPNEDLIKRMEGLLTKNYSALQRIEDELYEGTIHESILPRFEALGKELLHSLKIETNIGH